MPPPANPRDLPAADRELLDAYAAAGQSHVFRFWGELGAEERRELLSDARGLDLDLVTRLSREALDGEAPGRQLDTLEAIGSDLPDRGDAEEAGRELLRRGRVAFYTVAGGQGTRLGFDGPKGCFPIGKRPGQTLFSWHAEKVVAASRRYGVEVPWVLMVSETNESATRAYFEENDWFGLEGRVFFVCQRMLPGVDRDGRILLRSRSRIALSPNGHGGSIEALALGALPELGARGVEIVSYFQVDNALINPADPAFLGYHVLREAEMSAKVVAKRDPLEKAGVLAVLDGRPGVVEYTELPEDLAHETDEAGSLRFGLANIAAHVLSTSFVHRIRDTGLPYHVAEKKVLTVDDSGTPVEVIGRKFETFIFDAIPLACGFNVFLTERAEEFSPLKNAEGANSAATVHEALAARARRWHVAAGIPVPASEELEVSPITAYDLETFLEQATRSSGDGEA